MEKDLIMYYFSFIFFVGYGREIHFALQT